MDWRTVHPLTKQATRGECLVAYHFGAESHARTSGEPAVIGVSLGVGRSHMARLPVRGRGDDEANHRLRVPAAVHVACGQPIEQLGVGGRIALRAEVFACENDSAAEEAFPITV